MGIGGGEGSAVLDYIYTIEVLDSVEDLGERGGNFFISFYR